MFIHKFGYLNLADPTAHNLVCKSKNSYIAFDIESIPEGITVGVYVSDGVSNMTSCTSRVCTKYDDPLEKVIYFSNFILNNGPIYYKPKTELEIIRTNSFSESELKSLYETKYTIGHIVRFVVSMVYSRL